MHLLSFHFCHNYLSIYIISVSLVGAPIKINKVENPSEEEIDKFHQLYLEGLEKVFEDHKTKYGVPEDIHLEFV